MGLRGQYNYKGIPLPEAYARIDTVSSSDVHCTASINIYASRQAWINGDGYLEQRYPVPFIKNLGSNVGDDKTQGYIVIKQFPEWEDWEDVLEESNQ